MRALIDFEFGFHAHACCFLLCGVCHEYWLLRSYFTNIVQLLCSLSGWLHLNCSSVGTGFNGAETNSRIAHNLSILLMNSNCFAIVFSSILVTSVQIYISVSDQFSLPEEQCLQLSHQLTALCRPWDNNPSC